MSGLYLTFRPGDFHSNKKYFKACYIVFFLATIRAPFMGLDIYAPQKPIHYIQLCDSQLYVVSVRPSLLRDSNNCPP